MNTSLKTAALATSMGALLLALAACAPAPVGMLDTVFLMEGSGERQLSFSFDLGPEPRDLYFVFNNVSTSRVEGAPEILQASFDAPTDDPAGRSIVPGTALGRGKAIHVPVDYWKDVQSPSPEEGLSASVLSRGGTAAPNQDGVGDALNFNDHNFYTLLNQIVPATCRWTSGMDPVDMGNGEARKLSIWVADGQWDALGLEYSKVSQEMVDMMGSWFLGSAGARENSVYRLVTDMIGAEWGSGAPSNYIPFDQCITILLVDIIDSPEGQGGNNGGVVGYFYGGNNAIGPGSNERVMFVIDAPMFANSNDYGSNNEEMSPQPPPASTDWDWATSDFWPQFVYSTLAHEFQHMISFYQKQLLSYASERVWADEMYSMSVEDLIAWQMGVPGPRGVPAADFSAGSAENTDGRIPGFNEFTEIGLAASWDDLSLLGWEPYSISYAFGAYLIRNYGGPAFLERVYQSGKGGEAAVVEAARAFTGGQESFATLLKRFSAAVILSSWTEAPALYRFNKGAAGFSFTMDGGAERRLGSINFFNYVGSPYASVDGPLIRGSDLRMADEAPGYSHIFYRAGSGLSGTQSWSLSLPEGLGLSIVTRPSP